MKMIKRMFKKFINSYIEAVDMMYGDLYRQQFK